MRIRTVFAVALPLAFASLAAHADTIDAPDRTSRHVVQSKILDEPREIYVRTPPGYDGETALPVVYVLDGEWNFDLVAGYLDYMADNGVFPDLIVTGAVNVDRNRDYVPREDANFFGTGHADEFLGFVRNEWIPFVEENYSATGERILIGHSFGGVFTLYTLFEAPSLFDAYIALGSSAWIADRVLFERAARYFDARPDDDSFVYMAVGEGDGGPTTPSSKALSEEFEKHAPENLDWTFDITPKTDHFKNFVSGLHDGFMALFPAWGFADEVAARGMEEGSAGVTAWFAEKEFELGYRFYPSWFDFGVAAIRLSRGGHGDAAQTLAETMKTYHPDDPHLAAFTAQTYENLGEFEKALAEYERAIAITVENDLDPNVIRLDRLMASRERVLGKANEN